MHSELSIQETAARWGCSARRVQMLCKQGAIPGARKVSGVWLLPGDACPPGGDRRVPLPVFQPERLYGSNTKVLVSPGPEAPQAEPEGCTLTQHEILPGITLVFQDIHAETLDYSSQPPQLPQDLLAIQHCREGRFEGSYPNGESIYMGPGNLSINLPAWAPVTNSFPLRHYHGLYLAILPSLAQPAIARLEQVLGPLGIDCSSLSARLSGKNRLALYQVDETAAQLLSAIYPRPEGFRVEQVRLRVLELLQLLCAQDFLPPAPEQYFPREQVRTVKEIRRYLLDHLDQHISLPELASRFRISLTGMKACFKGVYGQSMGKYLREYRMQAGAEQLIATELRVMDIAAALGYENASKFSEAFAAYYGMPPQAYRKTFCPSGGAADGKE